MEYGKHAFPRRHELSPADEAINNGLRFGDAIAAISMRAILRSMRGVGFSTNGYGGLAAQIIDTSIGKLFYAFGNQKCKKSHDTTLGFSALAPLGRVTPLA